MHPTHVYTTITKSACMGTSCNVNMYHLIIRNACTCPKRFRLGVGWALAIVMIKKTDELLLMASQLYGEQAQTQDSASFDAVAQLMRWTVF